MIIANTRRRVSIEIGVLFDLAAIAALLGLCLALSYWPRLLRSAVEAALVPFALDPVQQARASMRLTNLFNSSRVSLLTAAIVIIAMIMSTRKFRWWRWTLAALLPLIYGYGIVYLNGPLTRALLAAGMTDGWYIGVYANLAIHLLAAATIAWIVSSRLVVALGVVAAFLSATYRLWIIHHMPLDPGGGRDSPSWYWVVAPTLQAVIALGLVIWAWQARRENPVFGLCSRCGYDLRGTRHARCPECGSPVLSPA